MGITAITLMGVGCSKNNDLSTDKLSLNDAAAYTAVTDDIHIKYVSPGTLDTTANINGGKAITFDNYQAWYDFTTVDSSANKGHASLREAWNLGFWAGGDLNRVILNYSVTTQAVKITGSTDIDNAIENYQSAIEVGYDSINGGTLGMGDLATFDFHKEGQFVIGTPGTSNTVYLIKTPAVQVHPDTTDAGTTISISYWLASVNWSNSKYNVTYRGVVLNG